MSDFDTWKVNLMRQAFDMKKRTGMKLGQCYETIAKAAGFQTYAAMRADHKPENRRLPGGKAF
jgi:hypothetical protein